MHSNNSSNLNELAQNCDDDEMIANVNESKEEGSDSDDELQDQHHNEELSSNNILKSLEMAEHNNELKDATKFVCDIVGCEKTYSLKVSQDVFLKAIFFPE